MSTQKLLPLTSSSSNKSSTPIAFNLTISKELQKIISNSNIKLKIIVNNGELKLKLNDDQLIYLNQLKEQSKTHIYKQFSSSTFKNIGIIHSRLNPVINQEVPIKNEIVETKSTKPSPPPSNSTHGSNHQRNRSNGSNTVSSSTTTSTSTTIKSSNLISKKLIYYLSLGPITIDELHQKTKFSISDIESNLRSISMIYTPRLPNQYIIKEYPKTPKQFNEQDRYFVLNYGNYKELKPGNYQDEDLKLIQKNCKLVFDYLKYPSNHPARLLMIPGVKEIPKEPKAIRKLTKDVPREEPKPLKRFNKPEIPQKRQRSNSPTTSEDEEYYKNLAQRFKSKYKEYKKLYKTIEILKKSKGGNVDKELKRLVELHKDLELWKKQLWKSVQQ
ncbi:hypothetical protein BN7_3348 [Wickerhamomyces ciferrii]|uniref:RNA polymerase II elongation factor ELL N-terminal domain-containing protein n=1 Tax=Wickerhamomyces ciferrii (strain ATCC 14091 / BCRC 22168 / CBS 111 / JCM 3599 / NBRC 0793 / NRRL Y-1031 F-60-10) TaxID=1206466 RepID=K0KRA8_WICCF|nr:uncharacterized protein BN7_3348 [Wickerhamomyces ciferrii]CCH43794.1 hypothetical protein BN7_3348 [Wickerhamomyces ciferrii]